VPAEATEALAEAWLFAGLAWRPLLRLALVVLALRRLLVLVGSPDAVVVSQHVQPGAQFADAHVVPVVAAHRFDGVAMAAKGSEDAPDVE